MTTWIAGAEIKGVVFIDSMVPDLQTLLGGVAPGERAFVLDMSAGGLEQIAAILAANNLTGVGSIAIVGHGASGSINVGTTVLNDADLAAHADALKAIGAAVKPGGTLDLFSCDTAAGPQGRAFIADLAKAAGVTVDAATHQIGRTATGPDWTLDATATASLARAPALASEPRAFSAAYTEPAADVSATPFTASAMQSYSGTLATQTNATGQLFVLDNASNSFRTDVYNTTTPAPAYTGTAATIPNANNYPSVFGFDSVNNLYFNVTRTARDVNNPSSSENLIIYNAAGQTLGTSGSISNNVANSDDSGVFAVDPVNHLVYVSTFTGTGNPDDAQQNQIFKVSYNPTTYAFGSIPYSTALTGGAETRTQSANNLQTLISTQSDSTFNQANQMVLNAATNQIFYTASYGASSFGGQNYPHNNGVYVIDATATNQKAVQLTNNTQFPTTSASVGAIAINPSQGLVYFTTAPRATNGTIDSSQTPALYVISMNAVGGTATQIAVPTNYLDRNDDIEGPTGQQDLVYDAGAQSLYILGRNSAGGATQITQVKLDTAGTALATSANDPSFTAVSTYLTPASPSNGYSGELAFNAMPTLRTTATATGTMAMQNGAAVNLLSGAPTITDPDSGGYLQSATVQVTQGGTVRAGDKLLINGTSFGTNATAYTDTTGARFNIAYSTSTNTLNIASISNAGTGITTTLGQYSSLLSKLQYQDGYTDNTTGATPTRTFTYHVNDGAIGDPYGINTTTSTIAIARTPPTLASGGVAVALLQGANAAGNALAGDSDPNGGALTVSAVQTGAGTQGTVGSALAGTYGTLTLSANGSYTYAAGNTAAINAVQGSHPIDSYSFTVSSPSGAANEAFRATIDRAPTANPDNVTATELGAPSTGNVLSNDTDADGDSLTVTSVVYNNMAYTPGSQITAQYGELTLNRDGTYTYTADNTVNYLANEPPRTDTFTYTDSDGLGGTSAATPLTFTVTCFATGTRIRVARDGGVADVPVEQLAVGDLAVTASGAHRAIRWIGSRLTLPRRHTRPHEGMPVRVFAHAFGENRPARDLLVSPGHSLCVDVVGEVLIPAVALINGTTITQEDVDTVTYWHVELDSHDILLAENMPAESYLEMGNRGFFAESDVVALDASPDAPVVTHADFCRPFHSEGALVEVVRAQLGARAENSAGGSRSRGWATSTSWSTACGSSRACAGCRRASPCRRVPRPSGSSRTPAFPPRSPPRRIAAPWACASPPSPSTTASARRAA